MNEISLQLVRNSIEDQEEGKRFGFCVWDRTTTSGMKTVNLSLKSSMRYHNAFRLFCFFRKNGTTANAQHIPTHLWISLRIYCCL